MTPARSNAATNPTNVVVVDGSNITTEGRSMPSLAQLSEAVMAFTEEYPDAIVTVVVDATFGHRIDRKEQAEFDAAVAHNEVVAPPAGAIGRGDAFVLSIANKVGARILSNDSFQEFHGDYPWLFDEGRLIGGKPVPFVGWVFVERLPVKGPVSRKATRAARGGSRDQRPSQRQASKEASLPMPVPTAPPPSARRGDRSTAPAQPAAEQPVPARVPAPSGAGPVNDLLPFLDFVEHHPVGSSVNGVVESYSSHGAYVTIGEVRGYVPLRLMGDPPPRSAREVMKIGDAATLVVTSFAPARRSIDLAIPKVATVAEVVPSPPIEEIAESVIAPKAPRKRAAKKAAAPAPEPIAAAVEEAIVEAALELSEPAPPTKKAAAKKSAAKKAPAKKSAAAKAPAKRAVAKQATAKDAPAAKKAPAKKTAAKKATPKKAASAPTVKPQAPAAPAASRRRGATKAAATHNAVAPAKRPARRRAAVPATATTATTDVAPAGQDGT